MFTLSRIIKVAPLGLIVTLCFAASGAHAQSADLRVDPVPQEGMGEPYFGAATAVDGRTAVVATPFAGLFETSPNFVGVVHIHTTDINRTAWSLQTTLHAEDATPANQGFGLALALAGRQLVIATAATLRFYEKTAQGFDLRDVVPLAGEHVPLSTPIDLANGVLAIRTTLDSGGSVVRLFRVSPRGKAKSLGQIQVEASSLSLDADGGALAIGSSTAGGRVFFYQRQGGNWRLKDTLEQPSAQAVGFGASVALHGRRFLAGAPSEGPPLDPTDPQEAFSGAVYAYYRQDGQWLQVQRVGTDDPTQAVFGLHRFGAKIATHGRHVLVSAPSNGDGSIGSMPTGPTTLFQWDASGLHSGRQALTSSDLGGIDVSGRYVIAGTPGFYFGGYFDGASVEDFADIDPGFSAEVSDSDGDPAD